MVVVDRERVESVASEDDVASPADNRGRQQQQLEQQGGMYNTLSRETSLEEGVGRILICVLNVLFFYHVFRIDQSRL